MAIMFIKVLMTDMKISVNDIAITLLGICYIVRIYIILAIITWGRKWKISNMVYITYCMGYRHLCIFDRNEIWEK